MTLRWLQIIERLLQQEPRLRPSAQEVLHKYLQPQVADATLMISTSTEDSLTVASPLKPAAAISTPRHAPGTAAAPQPTKHEDPAG